MGFSEPNQSRAPQPRLKTTGQPQISENLIQSGERS